MAYQVDDTITVDGETWRILQVGSVVDGQVALHLASTTRGVQQRNGWCPATTIHWADAPEQD
jgi:hypothetical protein